LGVGSVRSAYVRTFRPLETKPPQVLEHRGDKFRPHPRTIEIVAAEHERSARACRPIMSHRKGPGVPKMQEACGGRSETASIVGHFWHWRRGELNAKTAKTAKLFSRTKVIRKHFVMRSGSLLTKALLALLGPCDRQ